MEPHTIKMCIKLVTLLWKKLDVLGMKWLLVFIYLEHDFIWLTEQIQTLHLRYK
jgi:hypothetical protein